MRWKLKAILQSAASKLPFAAELNYLGQKTLMRRFRDIERPVADRFQRASWYAENWRAHSGVPLSGVTHFELGAGWHLALPLSLWCMGVNRQIIVDITRLAKVEIVNRAISCLSRLPMEMARRPEKPVRRMEDLEELYGIAYWAPYDARRVQLPAESADWVTATLTLQHIPAGTLVEIMAECRRILRPRGLFMAQTDYCDNYAYADRRISVYNFLQYSERQWGWFNSPLHYQNRLRHVQYRRMLQQAGFTVLREVVNGGTEKDREVIKRMKLPPEFAAFRAEELAVRNSRMAAGKTEGEDRRQTTADSERSLREGFMGEISWQ